MFKYACEFTVTGIGPVPIDMLRYDRCTPTTQEDVGKLTSAGSYDAQVAVNMIRFTEGKGQNYADNPTVKRWNSFGWQVTDITWRKLS